MDAPSDPFPLLDSGDLAALEALLDARPELARSRDARGLSLLLHAAYRKDPRAVELLRERVPAPDPFEAAALGETAVLATLLERDPDAVHRAQGDGFGPLHLAAYFGHGDCVALLLERGADPASVAAGSELRPLNCAVAGGDRACVEQLLAIGVDRDAPQRGGVTPLMGAAAAGREDLVDLLLAAGADPDRRGDHGSAADLARARGHADLALRLDG